MNDILQTRVFGLLYILELISIIGSAYKNTHHYRFQVYHYVNAIRRLFNQTEGLKLVKEVSL